MLIFLGPRLLLFSVGFELRAAKNLVQISVVKLIANHIELNVHFKKFIGKIFLVEFFGLIIYKKIPQTVCLVLSKHECRNHRNQEGTVLRDWYESCIVAVGGCSECRK